MSWIWQGRQLATAEKGGTTLNYTYDSEGIRTSKSDGTNTTKYLLNGTQILAQTTNGKTLCFFYDQQGNRVAMADSGNHFYYYIYNLQGDVIALADASTGKLVATYTYDAWGKIVKINGIDPNSVAESSIAKINPFRYRGYYYDTETSLYYLQTRYYDPEVGRFISPDKYTTTGQGVIGNNMFAYCNNNPIQYKDDNGDFCIQAAIIGGIVDAGVSIMCSIFDAAEKHEQLNVGEMLFDAGVSFALGFISSGSELKAIEKAVNIVDAGVSFVTSISRGDSLEEATVGAIATYVTSRVAGKAGNAVVGNTAKKTIADNAAESITSGIVSTELSGLRKVGKWIWNALFGSRNKSAVNPRREVRIHAFGG